MYVNMCWENELSIGYLLVLPTALHQSLASKLMVLLSCAVAQSNRHKNYYKKRIINYKN